MVEVCTRGVDTGFVALGYAKVAVLGVVQGITELLPISSTAHMRLVPAVLGWQDPGSAFSAAMQLAALAAVVSYFWSDVREFGGEFDPGNCPRPIWGSRSALLALDCACNYSHRHRRSVAGEIVEHVQFATSYGERYRLGLRGDGGSLRDRGSSCPSSAHDRGSIVS